VSDLHPDDVPLAPVAGGTVAPGVWRPGRRLLTAGLIAVVTAVAFESLAVSTVMPLVETDLGDLWLYGWVFSGFFLGNLVGLVVAGRAADRTVPAVPFTVGLVLFLVGLVVGGLAPGMAVLVVGRVLQGLGGGAMVAMAYVCIARGYPPRERPRMFALLSTAWVVPGLLGPAAAGLVGDALGWRWVFLGLAPITLAIGVMALGGVRALPASAAAASGPTPVLRALAVAVGAALVLAGLGAGSVWLAVPMVVVGAVLAVPAFLALTPPGTARARAGLPGIVATRGVLTFAFFTSNAFVPLALTAVKGASAVVGGLALTAAAVVWTAGSWVQDRYVYRVGPRRLVRVGMLVLAGGAAATLAAMLPGVPVAVSLAAWGVAGLGIGLAYSPLSVSALSAAESGREGAATSSLQLSDGLGTALGTGVAGVLVAAGVAVAGTEGPGLVAVFGLTIVVSGLGAVLAERVPDRLATHA
jgi:MFS family permease